MGSYWIVLTALLSAGPAANSLSDRPGSDRLDSPPFTADAAPAKPNRAPAQWRSAVHDALRREATAKGAAHESALRQLLALYNDLEKDSQLGDAQKRELRGVMRNRLARSSRTLESQLAKTAADSKTTGEAVAETVELLKGDPGVLAQRPAAPKPPIVSSPGQNNAQELVDLIQATIAPSTWDINGGPGVIRYFGNTQSLVIRQTDEVHGQLEGLIQQLRHDD